MAYRIISLDGGGIYGAHTAAVLARLESAHPGFVSDADMLAGTSIGGIIALGLANGVSTQEMLTMFENRTQDIFSRGSNWLAKSWRRLTSTLGWRSAYYSGGMLDVLTDILGDRLLMDSKQAMAIQSFQLKGLTADGSQNLGEHAVVFSNLDEAYKTMKAVDAGMATAAAPTYFPAYGSYVDGGVCSNNPSMSGVSLSIKNGANLQDIRLFSIGRHYPGDSVCRVNADWGDFGWINDVLGWLTAASPTAINEYCTQLLKSGYFRHAPMIEQKDNSTMDDVSLVEPLIEWANKLDLSEEIAWLKANW